VTAAFKEAGGEGKLRPGSVANLARKKNAGTGITPTTTIRLDPSDISRAGRSLPNADCAIGRI
jgi:hypothetical protein